MSTRTHPTTIATKTPVGWSAAEEKIVFEDMRDICLIVEKCVDATIRRYKPDTDYAQQLQKKHDALVGCMLQIQEQLNHITHVLRRGAKKPTTKKKAA